MNKEPEPRNWVIKVGNKYCTRSSFKNLSVVLSDDINAAKVFTFKRHTDYRIMCLADYLTWWSRNKNVLGYRPHICLLYTSDAADD